MYHGPLLVSKTTQFQQPSRFSVRRRQQSDAEDDDKALDISSLRLELYRRGEAIRLADEADLDLVMLSPDADPPVLRIMDYRKRRKEFHRRKVQAKNFSISSMLHFFPDPSRLDLKELKMGYNIDQHDYSVRMRAAQKFLKDGDKGRQNEFRNMAIELLKHFQSEVGELATEEAKSFSDKNMCIVLVPNKAILQKAQEPSKKKEKPAVNDVSSSV